MKNKKRMLGLSLGLVLLALVIGCFTVGSVDNETLTSTAGINVGDCGLIFINEI